MWNAELFSDMRLIQTGRWCASVVSPCRHAGEPEAVSRRLATCNHGLFFVPYLARLHCCRASCAWQRSNNDAQVRACPVSSNTHGGRGLD